MRKSRDILICSCISIVIGISMGGVSGLFGILLEDISELSGKYHLFLTPLLGLSGIIIVFMYKKFSPRSQQGLDLAIAYQMGEVDDEGRIQDFGRAKKNR